MVRCFISFSFPIEIKTDEVQNNGGRYSQPEIGRIKSLREKVCDRRDGNDDLAQVIKVFCCVLSLSFIH